MGHILLGWGQFRNAIREYKFALMLTSHSQIKLLCLNESGEAFLRLGDYDGAQESVSTSAEHRSREHHSLHLREQISNKRSGGS
jgi:hypothetical protein